VHHDCSSLYVRAVTEEDLEEIYRIETEGFDNPYPLQYLALLASLTDYYLVAECAGKVVGFIIAVKVDLDICHVLSIAVEKSYRRRGVGSILLQSVLHLCCEDGARAAMLEVAHTNYAAQSFYTVNDFHYTTVLPHYYGSGRHAIIMASTRPC